MLAGQATRGWRRHIALGSVLDGERAFGHEPHLALNCSYLALRSFGARSSMAIWQRDSITQKDLLSGTNGTSSRSNAAEIASAAPS